MPINFPDSRQEVIDRIKTDVQAELPQSNPFLRNSFLSALMVGYGGRVFEVYLQMQQLLKEMFPDTATGEFLARWGFYIGVQINPKTVATGFVIATGIDGTVIPTGTQFQSVSGFTYGSLLDVTVGLNLNDISSLTFSAGTVTAVTAGEHHYASGIDITISGAVETDYNGTFTITVKNPTTFEYTISGTPSSPATGTIKAQAFTANIEVQSVGFGLVQNLENGAALFSTTPIAGLGATVYVDANGIAGGTDQESQEDFRTRIIEKYQNPNTPFNVENIIATAKTEPGVTRVFVEEPDTTLGTRSVTSLTQTGNVAILVTALPHGLISGMYISVNGAAQLDYNLQNVPCLVLNATTLVYIVDNNPASPATGTIVASFAAVQPGQTRIFFTRDNDPNNIPDALEINKVRDRLLEIKPAHMAAQDLLTPPLVGVPVNFTFTSLVPNSVSMQESVKANLDQFFRESTEAGHNLLAKAYNSAIFATVDLETGEPLRNFSLAIPTGDITIQSGQIATLGEVLPP